MLLSHNKCYYFLPLTKVLGRSLKYLVTRQTHHGELAALLCEAWYVVFLAPGGPDQGADAGSPDHVDGDLVLLHGLDDPQVA